MKIIHLVLSIIFCNILLLPMQTPAQTVTSGIYRVQVDNVEYEINPIQGIADVWGGATWLKELNIPSIITNPTDGKKYSVRDIKEKAFFSHDSLTVVNITSGLQTVGISAFDGCKSLKTVVTGARDISATAFANCERITDISLPSEIQILGAAIFNNCKSLKSFSLENGPTSIPEYMFANCDSVNSIVLPETITSIGQSAFDGCFQLSVFSLPKQLKTIGRSAFRNCSSLRNIILTSDITLIQDNAFEFCGLKRIDLSPCTSCTLGKYVFKDCIELNKVVLPDNIEEIPAGIFYGCTNLTEVSLPQSVIRIDGAAFDHCGLKTVHIPSLVKEIGAYSFYGISEVTGCEGLEIIGDYAFSGYLTEFPFPSTLKTIGKCAFAHNQFTHVELPEGLASIGNAAFSPILNTDVDPSFYEEREILQHQRNNTIESVIIPSTLTNWGNYSFSGCNNLKSIKINNAKVAIRSDFNTCPKLETLDLGDSLISIGGLNYCPRLTELTIPGGIEGLNYNSFANTNVQVLQFKYGEKAFNFEKGLAYIVFGNKIKYLYIDRSIDFAHMMTDGLKTLVLGDHIKEMNFRDLHFVGSKGQLNSIIFGNNFTKSLNAETASLSAKNLIFNSIFPPQGMPISLLYNTRFSTTLLSRCWVPDESFKLYKDVWGDWLKSYNNIDVLTGNYIPIESLTIAQSINVTPGQAIEIPVSYYPDNASITNNLTWISLNQDIISYNTDGKFIANKSGVADVYCIAVDGSYIKSNLCTVTVADEIQQDRITITPHSVNLEKGEYVQLKVITEKDGSEISDVNWQSSDELIAVVSNTGILLARNDGRATITATLKANGDISDSIEIIVGKDSEIEDILADKDAYVKIFNLNGFLVYEGKYSDANLDPDYYIVVCDSKNIKMKVK